MTAERVRAAALVILRETHVLDAPSGWHTTVPPEALADLIVRRLALGIDPQQFDGVDDAQA
jgi:hypothetical protein